MNTWFYKNLGDAMMAWESLEQIEVLFHTAYKTPDNSEDLAVYSRHQSEGRLHCEVMVYFSPATRVIARELKAVPCQRPTRNGLSLLAGSENSWSILFPEHSA